MIQIERGKTNSEQQLFRLNLGDKMTDTTYSPLIGITSQLSKETVYFISFSFGISNKSRYVSLGVVTVVAPGAELLTLGTVYMGTKDRPFGLYDMTIYQNTSNTNLDPTGLTTIWNGLMNLKAADNFPAVEYNEYSANDTDTEAVYVTLE